ncbi:MAG: TlpA family protein disulfide reductase [Sphingobacteriia bacterium]|nr:TlpA family protein disulfide reductase [Sphingobacteriia bacterium]NCC41331.1 TlpA family protein disulfide reductase [Gammaproteobacteria bacterium]
MPRPIIATTILAFTLAVAVMSASAGGEETLTPITGDLQAPAFELEDPSGRTRRLADHLGQPLILNFWATWCPPCLAEMPAMQRAHEQVAPEGIAVVAINVGEDAETVSAFLAERPVDFPIPLDLDSSVVQRYPVKGLPTTFVIDPSGRLVYVATGEREWDDPRLLDQVRALKSSP